MKASLKTARTEGARNPETIVQEPRRRRPYKPESRPDFDRPKNTGEKCAKGGQTPTLSVPDFVPTSIAIAAYDRRACIMRAIPRSAWPHRCQGICLWPALAPRLADGP